MSEMIKACTRHIIDGCISGSTLVEFSLEYSKVLAALVALLTILAFPINVEGKESVAAQSLEPASAAES